MAIQYLITAAIDADSSPSEENEMLLETERTALLSAILEVEKERDALKEAIENIVNLGVQRLPVDKRWGTAFAIALETEKRLYRPAVPEGDVK